MMSKRLQVILDDTEWAELGRVARAEGLTVSEWVRRTLRRARHITAGGDIPTKLAYIRAAADNDFPTADIDQMLRDIDRGARA